MSFNVHFALIKGHKFLQNNKMHNYATTFIEPTGPLLDSFNGCVASLLMSSWWHFRCVQLTF